MPTHEAINAIKYAIKKTKYLLLNFQSPVKPILKKNITNQHSLSISLSILILAFFIQVIRFGDSVIPIHDNLDGAIPNFKILKDSGLIFSQGTLPIYPDGIDRNWFYSEFQLTTLLYTQLDTLAAYFLVIFLKLTISFFSMRALLGISLFKIRPAIADGIAVCFALLPGFPAAYLAQASLPLAVILLYEACITSNHKKLMVVSSALFIFPVLSSLVFYGLFLLISASLIATILLAINTRAGGRLIVGLFFLTLGYIVVEWRLFYLIFTSVEPSLRSEFMSLADQKSFLMYFFDYYRISQYHSEAMQGTLLYWFVPLLIMIIAINNRSINAVKLALVVYFFIIIHCLLAAFFSMGYFNLQIQLNRFVFLNPMLWYLALGLTLNEINKKYYPVILLIILLQGSVIIGTTSHYNALKANFFIDETEFTFNEFYSSELFANIQKDIDYQGELSVAVGFHPSILMYNDIKTLDGYAPVGNLSYKHRFRQLIAPQLEVNANQRRYYDNWGGRKYIFTDYNYYSKLPKNEKYCHIQELRIDMRQFIKMKGKYIFSRCEINNANQLGIRKIKQYEDAHSPYFIRVYTQED